MRSAQLHVATYPTGRIGPEQFAVVEVDLPGPDELEDGEVLVRNT